MRLILVLDISLLVSGIARKHRIVPKTIFGVPSILPPPPQFHFLLQTRDFLRKRVCGFSNWRLQESVFNRANLFVGAIFMFPPINPPNPVSFRWTEWQTETKYTRYTWAGGTFFQLCCCVSFLVVAEIVFRWYLPTIPVVLLCLFFVAAGNSFWFHRSVFGCASQNRKRLVLNLNDTQ